MVAGVKEFFAALDELQIPQERIQSFHIMHRLISINHDNLFIGERFQIFVELAHEQKFMLRL